ncbi:hypothetical protein EDI_005870 [Entamoeba dispar SAW760]|uniref:Uncharacterized protein n=1 Tax=Entamoeba dispar (strain ATCC PRA-260 / SAW760) TaxID=370354 RepID=B0ECM7_ENTDS|nr:uncharacterized protein EDI_005870 [Entamoeba dispar SAW760]EDR27717.1 hypothetical protein EDI_005870 [Entamoeba dispar SAW760]|eukprot:EDR27717.1 hypothetical protein EDI_005870 [Entamoeba dispar SAW760]
MNIIFIGLLISFVMSESIIITTLKSSDGHTITFKNIEFGKCYYTGTRSSDYYTHRGNNITISHYTSSSTCTGNKNETFVDINDKEIRKFCNQEANCSIEIKEKPYYIGYISFVEDDDQCSNHNNIYATYLTNTCAKYDKNSTVYSMLKVENGSMYHKFYSTEKCDEQKRVDAIKLWECGLCENGIIHKCENKTINPTDEKSNDHSEASNNQEDSSMNQSDEKSMSPSEEESKSYSEDSSNHNIDGASLTILSLIGMMVMLFV